MYCFFLPFQIWAAMKWYTIPATGILSFIYFGFLAAGEEIENPFGCDMNDLNLDHFTHNILRYEMRAITAHSAPDPVRWAFSHDNDLIFSGSDSGERVSPQEWIQRGPSDIQAALSLA